MVAILLENFTAATHAEEINSERKKMQKSGLDKMHHTLDPIFDLLRWNTVKTESDDVEDETKDEIIIIASFVSSAAPLCRGAARKKCKENLSKFFWEFSLGPSNLHACAWKFFVCLLCLWKNLQPLQHGSRPLTKNRQFVYGDDRRWTGTHSLLH